MQYLRSFILALGFLFSQLAHSQVDALASRKLWKNLTQTEIRVMEDFIERVSKEHGLFQSHDDIDRKEEGDEDLSYLTASNSRLIRYFVNRTRQFYGGQLVPASVASDIRFPKKGLKEDKIRKMLADSQGSTDALVAMLEPKFFEYRVHLQMLNRLRNLEAKNRWGSLRLRKSLKLGVKDESVVRVKQRLADFGYHISSFNPIYDEETANAIGDVQTQLKNKPDRVLTRGGPTQRYLEVSLRRRIEDVRADLEKIRWLPQDTRDRFIFVNLAFSYFLLIDRAQPNPVVFNFKAINGRFERKTPSMVDRISEVMLNPFWTVPETILVEDKVPILRGLNRAGIREYFDKYNYVLYDLKYAKRIDPTTINWRGVYKGNVQFHMRQRPNYFSALGVVRFPMWNKEFIYLHDTGERELFQQNNRLLSSGCMRLEKPIDVAEYLLAGTEWNRTAIENFVSKPGEVKDDETTIPMKTPIWVYTLPITTHMASDGVMRFADDVYGHNAAIRRQTYSY